MKWRSTIVSSFLLILYAGVLLHNTIPHMHTEEQVDHAATHQHHHSSTDAHHHHEGSDDSSPEAPPFWADLAGLFTHASLGVNHFGSFTGTHYSFAPSVILAVLLLFGSLWPRLLLYRVTKPPDDAPDQRQQLHCLSASSRRGPPACS